MNLQNVFCDIIILINILKTVLNKYYAERVQDSNFFFFTETVQIQIILTPKKVICTLSNNHFSVFQTNMVNASILMVI